MAVSSEMQLQGRVQVAMLSIPGLTHPVRDLHLEDVLERTRFVIGRGSRYGCSASYTSTSCIYCPPPPSPLCTAPSALHA